jgi:hypothetical protein
MLLMARPLPVLNSASVAQPESTRKGQVRAGIWIELVTIVWMTIEASVAITVGFATRSVSLQGFGIDSIIELIAGGILLWRLLVEQRGESLEPEGVTTYKSIVCSSTWVRRAGAGMESAKDSADSRERGTDLAPSRIATRSGSIFKFCTAVRTCL